MPIQIHGNEYFTVAERVREAHKETSANDKLEITTEVLYQSPVVIKATVITKKGTFTGISAANPNKAIEKMSPYEVAETSAVGRALGFAGYGMVDSIASADEMHKATNQEADPTEEWNGPVRSEDEPYCEEHNVKYFHYVKGEKSWYSHKNADGTWCNMK